jgi:hypothetical protein
MRRRCFWNTSQHANAYRPMIISSVLRHAVLVAATCLLIASLAEAQTTGQVEGTVVDGSGRPVADVTVRARHVPTDTTYTVKTDDLGRYRFTLPMGTYEVTTAASPDLGPAILTVKVTLGASTTANFDPSTPAKPESRGLQRSRRLEASGRLGWTFSDGVSAGRNVEAGDGNIYNRIDAVDSMSWGFTLGVFLTPHLELEFLFDRQASTLQVGGTSEVDVGDLGIGNYHGIVSYNFGATTRPVRLFAFGGVGATTYGSVTFTGREGQAREIDGGTKLSGTLGGGVKIYRGAVGARLEGRFTPTYIKSTDDGWWCDEYWGCYSVDQLHYAKQFEFSGGVTFRF